MNVVAKVKLRLFTFITKSNQAEKVRYIKNSQIETPEFLPLLKINPAILAL